MKHQIIYEHFINHKPTHTMACSYGRGENKQLLIEMDISINQLYYIVKDHENEIHRSQSLKLAIHKYNEV